MSVNLSKSATWKQLEANWDKGFEQLTLEEQQTIALYWLEAETMNGGLDQFFHNSSGDLAILALDGLKRLNCMQTHQILSELISLIFGEHYPLIREERFSYLEKVSTKLGPDYEREATNFIQDLTEEFMCIALADLEQIYLTKK